MGFRARYDAFDRYQRRHRWLGFPLAVFQKYSDDEGRYLAATITYYGFFSLFPLLLVATTVLGFVLRHHRHLEKSIVDSALGQFPVVGHDLQLHTLHGSGAALAVGLAISLWSGMGVFIATEDAMYRLWGIPARGRPNFLRRRGRALAMLVVLGAAALGTTVLGALATFGGSDMVVKIAVVALTTLLDIGLFWVTFRLLTVRSVSWRALRGGAVAAGIAWQVLQAAGGLYVAHVLRHASNVYGTFAGVIGLLSFIYLASYLTLLAAESNVVAARRLWPRSFSVVFQQPPTDADRRALTQLAQQAERRPGETVEVELPT